MRTVILLVLIMLGSNLLGGCERTPPSVAEMRNALQTAFDEEAKSGGSSAAKVLKISTFTVDHCAFGDMIGSSVYQCDVTISIGGPDRPGPTLKPKPVVFKKSRNGWIVPN